MNQNELNESNTRTIRALFGKFSERTHGLTAETDVAVLVEIARIEVQLPREERIVRIRRREPVVAARASAEEDRVDAEAGRRKEDALIGISTLASNKSPINAVLGRPCGSAIVDEILKL